MLLMLCPFLLVRCTKFFLQDFPLAPPPARHRPQLPPWLLRPRSPRRPPPGPRCARSTSRLRGACRVPLLPCHARPRPTLLPHHVRPRLTCLRQSSSRPHCGRSPRCTHAAHRLLLLCSTARPLCPRALRPFLQCAISMACRHGQRLGIGCHLARFSTPPPCLPSRRPTIVLWLILIGELLW